MHTVALEEKGCRSRSLLFLSHWWQPEKCLWLHPMGKTLLKLSKYYWVVNHILYLLMMIQAQSIHWFQLNYSIIAYSNRVKFMLVFLKAIIWQSSSALMWLAVTMTGIYLCILQFLMYNACMLQWIWIAILGKWSHEVKQVSQKLGRQGWRCCKRYVCSTFMLRLFALKNGSRGSRSSF